MRQINFANQSMKRKTPWSKKAVVILLFTITITLVIMHLKQRTMLSQLEREKKQLTAYTKNLNTVLQDKKELLEKKQSVEQKLKKLKKIENNQHAHCSFFQKTQNSLGQFGTLQSMDLSRKKIAITIACPTIKKAARFIKTMNELPYVAQLKLNSINPDKQNLLFNITGSFI